LTLFLFSRSTRNPTLLRTRFW